MLNSPNSLPTPIPQIPSAPFPPQSQLPPPTLTPSSRHRLHDALYPLRDLLVVQRSFGSIANLMRSNKEFCGIFKLALEGRRIVLRGREASREIFKDIVGGELAVVHRLEIAQMAYVLSLQACHTQARREETQTLVVTPFESSYIDWSSSPKVASISV
jgi:hypothetical protein